MGTRFVGWMRRGWVKWSEVTVPFDDRKEVKKLLNSIRNTDGRGIPITKVVLPEGVHPGGPWAVVESEVGEE